MLRPEIDEASLYKARSWLLYWYEVADKLFVEYGVSAESPHADWFMRPLGIEGHIPNRHRRGLGARVVLQSASARSPSRATTELVELPSTNVHQVRSKDREMDIDTFCRVEAWVQTQSDFSSDQKITHGTDGRRLLSLKHGNRPRLNPMAEVFVPLSSPHSRGSSQSHRSNEQQIGPESLAGHPPAFHT
ncbi:hypothetical protein B0T10DRAFT_239328 [Thelonectria olida]|uniref:Uncharacterized protein n=1 Tax=Thelonectria olida TaxID=1576542 RepID=A0A9P8WAR6_9HYPO|nr:hypothetical protein B0T10DRAFT_239328 [Thelonectria olida]